MPPAPYPPPRSKHLYNPLPTLKLSTKNVSTLHKNGRASSSNSVEPHLIKHVDIRTSKREIELNDDDDDEDEDEELEVEKSLLRHSQSTSTIMQDVPSTGAHDISMTANNLAQLNPEALLAITRQVPIIRRSRLPAVLPSTPFLNASPQPLVNSPTKNLTSSTAPPKRSRLPQTLTSTTSSRIESSGNIPMDFLTISDTSSEALDEDASTQKRPKLDVVEKNDGDSEINKAILPSFTTSLPIVAPSQQLKARTSLVASLKPKASRLPPRISSDSFPSSPSIHPSATSQMSPSTTSIPTLVSHQVKRYGSATKSASRSLPSPTLFVHLPPSPLHPLSCTSSLNVSTSQPILSPSPALSTSIDKPSSAILLPIIPDQETHFSSNLNRTNSARKSAPNQNRLASAKKTAPQQQKARKSAPSALRADEDSADTEIEDGGDEAKGFSREEQQEDLKPVESILATNFYQSTNSFNPFKRVNLGLSTTTTANSNLNTTTITFPSTSRIAETNEFRVICHPSDPEYIPLSANNQPYLPSTNFPLGQIIPKRPESKSTLILKQSSEVGIFQNSIKSNNSSRIGTPIPPHMSGSGHRGRSFTDGSISDDSDDSTIYQSNKKGKSLSISREVSTSASVSGVEGMDGKSVDTILSLSREIIGYDLAVEDELSTTNHDQLFHIIIESIQIPTSDIPNSIRAAGYMVLRLVFSLSLPFEEDNPEDLNATNYELSDTSTIAAQFTFSPSDASSSLTILIPQKPLFCDLNLFPNLRYNRTITDLDFSVKACFPEVGNTLNSSTTFSTFNTSTRIISCGRFIDSPSSTILYAFLENEEDNKTKGDKSGIYLRWNKTLVNRNSAQQDEELVRKVDELILKDTKVWLPEGIKMKRQLGWSRRPGKDGTVKKIRRKVTNLGPFKRTYSTLTREPEIPASNSRWEDDDNPRASAALIRETDQILATLQISAPYLSQPESVIISKLHSRFVRINGYPRSIVEREISTWSYFAPVLLHHFHSSRNLYPQFTTAERVKLSIGLFLRSFTRCNLLNQAAYLEIIQSFSNRIDSIELTGEAGGEEFLKMRENLGGW